MKKALKELIENAQEYNGELLTSLLIIPSGKLYDGFWGKNGYEYVNVIGCKVDGGQRTHYKITIDKADVVNVFAVEIDSIDIPHELGCVHISFNKPIVCTENNLSSCTFEPYEKGDLCVGSHMEDENKTLICGIQELTKWVEHINEELVPIDFVSIWAAQKIAGCFKPKVIEEQAEIPIYRVKHD